MNGVRLTYFVFYFLIAITSALIQYGQSQQDDQTNELPLPSLSFKEEFVRQCKLYRETRMEEYNYLKTSYPSLHVPRAGFIKIPAACLYALTDDYVAEEILDLFQMKFNEKLISIENFINKTLSNTKPSQFINWLVDFSQYQAKRPKRDLNMTKPSSSQLNADKLLSKYLFDTSDKDKMLTEKTSYLNSLNSIDDTKDKYTKEAYQKLHEAGDLLVNSGKFNDIISGNRRKLAKYLSPVILIPGLAGSRMEVKVSRNYSSGFLCKKRVGWTNAWLSVNDFLPISVNCWLQMMSMSIDPQTGYAQNVDGVSSRSVEFGSLASVSSLDLSFPELTEYFAPIIRRYKSLGYTPDYNLLAAPYDFRLSPLQLENQYFADLKQLIEKAKYDSPSGKPVTLVCHSMGCLNTLVFIRKQTTEWRKEYIRKLITLSSPWAGSIQALKALVVGDTLNLPLINEKKLRKIVRTFPSVPFLLPNKQVFEQTNSRRAVPGGPVLIKTPIFSYKVADVGKVLQELNLTIASYWYDKLIDLVQPLNPLNDVLVDCLHGNNLPTQEQILFDKQSEYPDGEYTTIYGNGDGTVNLESLDVCGQWKLMQPNLIKHIVIPNVSHTGIMSHKDTLTYITDDVLA